MSEDYDEPADAAAEAFEGLSGQIEKMMAMLEGARASGAVDYSLTLGKIAKSLAAIEAHPAMKMTPDSYQAQGLRAVEQARDLGRRDVELVLQQLRATAADLDRRGKAARDRREQTKWLVAVTVIGAAAAVFAWIGVSGPIARMLPRGWDVPERSSALMMNTDLWAGGQRMMEASDAAKWGQIQAAVSLVTANEAAISTCRDRALRSSKAQRCSILIGPQFQSAGSAGGR